MVCHCLFKKGILYLVCIFLLFNVGCKLNSIPDEEHKDSITILYHGDERIFLQDYSGMEAVYWIFQPLVKHSGDEKGEIVPVLAESWMHSDDYKTWTVKLRRDIFWHDGVQMTANDVKFTIDLRTKESGIKEFDCEIIDDFTFILTASKPVSNLETWQVYYPKHLLQNLDPKDYYNWDFWKQPIGNGPYKFVRNMDKSMVEVEANPHYFSDKPKIKKAILKFSQGNPLQELLSGSVDALTYVSRELLIKIDDDARFKSYYSWGGGIHALIWNHNIPLFKEAKVRKALTLATNRVELSKVLFYPDDIPITDVISTRQQRNTNDLPTGLPYDPKKALELLKECGWADTNNDGILDRDGVDFEFELTVNDQFKLMATYIQDNFRKIGITMEIVAIERSVIKQRFKSGANFESILTLMHNRFDFTRLRDYFGENSKIGYQNKKMDSIFDLMKDTGDLIELDRLSKELIPVFEMDMPLTFLLPMISTHVVKSNLMGLSNHYNPDPVWFLEKLWIE